MSAIVISGRGDVGRGGVLGWGHVCRHGGQTAHFPHNHAANLFQRHIRRRPQGVVRRRCSLASFITARPSQSWVAASALRSGRRQFDPRRGAAAASRLWASVHTHAPRRRVAADSLRWDTCGLSLNRVPSRSPVSVVLLNYRQRPTRNRSGKSMSTAETTHTAAG